MPLYLSDKHNLTAVAAPAITDDRNDGYHEGSRWINVLTGIEYVCIDATVGSARWQVNPYAGIDGVAGLRAAMGGVIASPTRFTLREQFTKRPVAAAEVTIFTDSTGGVLTTPNTLADQNDAVTGVDGAGSNAAGKTDVDARLVTIANNVGKLAAKVNTMLLANQDFELFGTNMTTALCTQNAARGGIRLTTAGAANDIAGLQPRKTNTGDSRWALGFTTDLRPIWYTSFRLTSIGLISFKAALSLTNAHDLGTDADQVGLWLDTTETVPATVDNPNFRIITSAGGTDVDTDTGIPAVAGTEYTLELEHQADRRVVVRLNGVQIGQTGALVTAKNLIPHMSLKALEAAAKSYDVRLQTASMLNAA